MSSSFIGTAVHAVASLLRSAVRGCDAHLYLLISSSSLMVTYVLLVFRKRRDHASRTAGTSASTPAAVRPAMTAAAGTYTQTTANYGSQTSPKAGGRKVRTAFFFLFSSLVLLCMCGACRTTVNDSPSRQPPNAHTI